MLTRRAFLRAGTAGTVAIAAFTNESLARVARESPFVSGGGSVSLLDTHAARSCTPDAGLLAIGSDKPALGLESQVELVGVRLEKAGQAFSLGGQL